VLSAGLLQVGPVIAAQNAEQGLVGYLEKQVIANPVAFLGLLGKVLPMQMTSEGGGPLEIRWAE
jgi:hypothetical protein